MKKWIKIQLIAATGLLLSSKGVSQTETFDIITFTPPLNWTKDLKPGVLNYMNVDRNTGQFCILTIYASAKSAGDAQQDFKNEWKRLVADPFQVSNDPKPEKEFTAEGWDVWAAAAPVKVDGADIYVFLTVLSGHGKMLSIKSSLNSEAYLKDITEFMENIQLDKDKPVANTSPTLAPTTLAGSEQFGMMTYTAPPGWSHQLFTDGVLFKPLDLPQGEHLSVQIMQPLTGSGSLEQALQQSFDEAATMYNGTKMNYAGTGKNYQATQPRKSFQGWDYIKATGGIRIGDPEFGLDVFVIRINDRFERLAILKSRTINRSCSMSAYDADSRQSYRNAIDELFFSIQFKDGSGPLVQPGTIGDGGILGVWQGISMQMSASSGLRYSVYAPIFLSNGQAFFGDKFPPEGLDGLDTRIPAELFQRNWGTYTFSNGRGVIKMPYGDLPLRMEAGKLVITANNTDHRFYQLPSVDGAKFNGTYTMAEAYGKIPAISFTSSGQFTDNGAIRILYHEYNDCVNPAISPGSGTYEVKDHTIHFNYNDGRKIKIAFLGTEYDRNDPSPAVIRLSNNEDPLNRR